MWTRIELKYRAKEVLRKCYWAAVVVALVAGILTGNVGGSARGNSHVTEQSYNGVQESGQNIMGSAADMIRNNVAGALSSSQHLLGKIVGTGFDIIFLGIGVVVMLLGLAIGILVGNPVQVGACRFFMCSRQWNTRIGEMFFMFRRMSEFWNVVLIMFVMELKIVLWSLLFVIPGIVKSYEYQMIPYILAENPGISMSRAFELSREMTFGEKMNLFVLDLSFLPWQLLSAMTCGLVGVFWVNPYVAATKAELYGVLRENALHAGTANGYDLPGF